MGQAIWNDGADATQGQTTDAGVQGDLPGSVSAKLRGINAILAQLAADLAPESPTGGSYEPIDLGTSLGAFLQEMRDIMLDIRTECRATRLCLESYVNEGSLTPQDFLDMAIDFEDGNDAR